MKKFKILISSILLLAFASTPVFADINAKEKAYIKKYVLYAKGYIEKNGLTKSVTDFNNAKRDAKKNSLYVFGFVCGTEKMDGFSLIHPAQPERIYSDVSDDPIIQKLMGASLENPDGIWVKYNWQNPRTKQLEPKESYMVYLPEQHLCIGSGFYY